MRKLFTVLGCVLLLSGCSKAGVKPPVASMVSLPSPPPPPSSLSPISLKSALAAPVYPGFEAEYGVGGTTLLLMLVGKDGRPLDIKVSRSSGSRELDRAAINAAIHWQFNPERKNGFPVEGYARIPVNFSETTIAGDPAWEPAYRHAPIVMDSAPIPYSNVAQAVVGVAALAHEAVYDSVHHSYHVYAIDDTRNVLRELWYFTDVSTDQAMVVRYTFTGTPGHPAVLAATLCNRAALCRQREPLVREGPYSKRVSAE